MTSRQNSSLDESSKLKCFCNDEALCPSVWTLPDGTSKRFCTTDTVCMTTRYERADDGEQFLRYFCNKELYDSIRQTIIQYRDCKINAATADEVDYIREHSAEYCCDSGDFCNEVLDPTKSIKQIIGTVNPAGFPSYRIIDNPSLNSTDSSNSSPDDFTNLFTTINIIFLSILSVSILIILSILLMFVIRRWQKVNKIKQKASNHLSSLSTGSSGASTTSSSKSKSTTVSTGTTLTTVHSQIVEKCDHLIPAQIQLHNNFSYPNPVQRQNDYTQKSLHQQVIAEAELLEPLIEKRNPASKTHNQEFQINKINETSLTHGSDFCTTSECYTTDISSSSQNANNNMFSTQSSSGTNSNGFEWSGSGSGAGVPELLQRTIARQIKLIYPCIGKGRFGEVYKGLWRDEHIAVKTFNSADEKSWENECQIYNTSGFRHENILGFIASDNIDRGTYTELWIITEFHHNGSLYDYLNQPNLKQTPKDTLRMALSIVNGLDHLHTAIESCTGKPALAHCDLKSKNVLVKSDLTCCISDLGLALCGDKNGNVTQNVATIRTGTKRYMAPEILAKTINYKSLLQFQSAEMYSLALVFWELLRRTDFEFASVSYSYDYKMPYYEYIQSDPDELQMKQLVCDEQIRPEINSLWRQVPILSELTELTEEVWVENAEGRLNALRLKKSLNQVKRNHL